MKTDVICVDPIVLGQGIQKELLNVIKPAYFVLYVVFWENSAHPPAPPALRTLSWHSICFACSLIALPRTMVQNSASPQLKAIEGGFFDATV